MEAARSTEAPEAEPANGTADVAGILSMSIYASLPSYITLFTDSASVLHSGRVI